MSPARNSFNSFGFGWVSFTPSPYLFLARSFGSNARRISMLHVQAESEPSSPCLFAFFGSPWEGFAFEPRLKFAEHRRGITSLILLIFFVGLGLQFFLCACVLFFGIDSASFWRWRLLLIFRGLVLGLGPFCNSVRDWNMGLRAWERRISDKASRNRSWRSA